MAVCDEGGAAVRWCSVVAWRGLQQCGVVVWRCGGEAEWRAHDHMETIIGAGEGNSLRIAGPTHHTAAPLVMDARSLMAGSLPMTLMR